MLYLTFKRTQINPFKKQFNFMAQDKQVTHRPTLKRVQCNQLQGCTNFQAQPQYPCR